jgi:hypothetical protein
MFFFWTEGVYNSLAEQLCVCLEQGPDRCLHELSRETCTCSRLWKATGRESEQRQRNAGHPHKEAQARGSEAVVVGTGGDGVEDSRGGEAPSTMSVAATSRRIWRRGGSRSTAALRTSSRARQKMAKAAIVIAGVQELRSRSQSFSRLAAVRLFLFFFFDNASGLVVAV